jgi:hypothetical protein
MSIALTQATNRLLAQIQADEYCEALVEDMTTQVAATNTTYNRNVFIRKTNATLTAAGALKYTAVPHYAVFDLPDETVVDVPTIQYYINEYLAAGTGNPIMLNVEAWDLSSTADYAYAIEQLNTVASMWLEQTGSDQGWYLLLPEFVYSDSVNLGTAIATANLSATAIYRARLSRRMVDDTNRFANDLFPYVQTMLPQCYVSSAYTLAQFKWNAAEMILEALRIADGRPVYPVVWDHKLGDSSELSDADFRDMLQFVAAFPGIAGVYMWEGTEDRIATYNTVVTELLAGTGDFPDP